MDYETPVLTDLGSVEELTLSPICKSIGGDDGYGLDTGESLGDCSF